MPSEIDHLAFVTGNAWRLFGVDCVPGLLAIYKSDKRALTCKKTSVGSVKIFGRVGDIFDYC